MVPRRRDEVIEALRQRFLSASHLGLLKPGDKLPSARDVAREMGVDRKVVLAAYRWLEREGVIELRQRSGIYFAPAAVPGAASARAGWLVETFAEALAHGIPAQRLGDELHRHVSRLRLRVVCVECNDDQIASLCGELTTYYGMDAEGFALDPQRDQSAQLAGEGPEAPPIALRRADLLVTTPFHASEVKLIAERLGKAWLAVTLRADVLADLARRLADGPAYAVVADPRFAHKLTLVFASTVGASNFRALVVGRDDLTRIPEGAPTYVTRLAHERLDGAPLAIREFPEPRAFSSESSRELLAFIVQANAGVLGREIVVGS